MRDFADDSPPVRSAQGGLVHFMVKTMKLIVALSVVVIAVAIFIPEFRQMEDIKRHNAGLDQMLTTEKRKLAEQSRKLDYLRNDPAYVEIIARDRLDMMRPGETIFRFDPAATTANSAPR